MTDKLLAASKLINEMRGLLLRSSSPADEYSIFLCGGRSSEQKSYRDRIRSRITKIRSKFLYTVHYPEILFVNLLHGHDRSDLLTLENVLADSVHAVVLIVESPGALVELGAFANHERLAKKLIVIINEKFRLHRSFINLGPVRMLQQKKLGQVLYADFSAANLSDVARDICTATRAVATANPIDTSLGNPIMSRHVYLALAFCLDPISQQELPAIVSLLAP